MNGVYTDTELKLSPTLLDTCALARLCVRWSFVLTPDSDSVVPKGLAWQEA